LKEYIMDVILMIFGMSFVDNMMTQPPQAPQAVVAEVIKFQPKKDEPDQYSWLNPELNKNSQ
jgi:hypothetical protein